MKAHIFPLFLAALAAASRQEPKAPSDDDVAAAGRLFQRACSACHFAADSSFEIDRAWLNQVYDTA